MTTYRISNGVEVPAGLRGKLVEIGEAERLINHQPEAA